MNIKKLLSGILTTCVIGTSFLSALPVSAQAITEGAHTQVSAEEQKNLQTAESPTKEFAIKNKKDFSKFMTTPEYWESNYKIKLNCDISWIFFKKFNPIEDFKGDFDGGGNTIKYVKLRCFAKNNHGKISRLNFQKSKLLSSGCGFVENNYGTITECTATGDVKGEKEEVVGGFLKNNYGIISDCTAKGNVNGYICLSRFVGGFVGENKGKITNCAATGNVKGLHGVGGFVGINHADATIYNCTVKGNIDGSAVSINGCVSVGGFIGENHGTIENCTAIVVVKLRFGDFYTRIDSFAGINEGKIEDCKIA
ncbi:MAG: hypothetical protein K2G97_03455 [Oscillospiraceae bacterium]|nr:hypothetical protein [Oscillospiraceae bacterium]